MKLQERQHCILDFPKICNHRTLLSQTVKNLPAMWETWVWSMGWEDSLEKGKATHSSTVAWRIPWTSPCGSKQLDTTEWLSLHFTSISYSRGSSWTRDRTHISCNDRWILYHWNLLGSTRPPKKYRWQAWCKDFLKHSGYHSTTERRSEVHTG